jgi:hypothetical protein
MNQNPQPHWYKKLAVIFTEQYTIRLARFSGKIPCKKYAYNAGKAWTESTTNPTKQRFK